MRGEQDVPIRDSAHSFVNHADDTSSLKASEENPTMLPPTVHVAFHDDGQLSHSTHLDLFGKSSASRAKASDRIRVLSAAGLLRFPRLTIGFDHDKGVAGLWDSR